MSEWMPIESAPKDGTVIDVLNRHGERFTDVWWEASKQDWLFWGYDGWGMGSIRVGMPLTHWMPLPDPPSNFPPPGFVQPEKLK